MSVSCPALLGDPWKLATDFDSKDWEEEEQFWNALRFSQNLRRLCVSGFFHPECFVDVLTSNLNLRELYISYLEGFEVFATDLELKSLEILHIENCIEVVPESLISIFAKALYLRSLSIKVQFDGEIDLNPLKILQNLVHFDFDCPELQPGTLAALSNGNSSTQLWPQLTRLSTWNLTDEDANFVLYFAHQLQDLRLSNCFGPDTLPQILSRMRIVSDLELEALPYLTNDILDQLNIAARKSISKLTLTNCILLSSPKCNEIFRSISSLHQLRISGSPDIELGSEFSQQEEAPIVVRRYNAM